MVHIFLLEALAGAWATQEFRISRSPVDSSMYLGAESNDGCASGSSAIVLLGFVFVAHVFVSIA